jgi:flagellar basal body rod protein FlgG
MMVTIHYKGKTYNKDTKGLAAFKADFPEMYERVINNRKVKKSAEKVQILNDNVEKPVKKKSKKASTKKGAKA